ncbi:MAG: Hpt domain-containing protein [Chloroflexota bacterium]|nr:Hpt domain-containing protein [Chloroflexota bacterium]
MSAIDRTVLDELRQSIGDDPEFLRELVEAYIDDAPAQLASIRVGLAEGDVVLVNRAAHTLKSNSASVGAVGLAEMCRELEAVTQPAVMDATDLASPGFAARLHVIAAELQRVTTELDALVPANVA